tara:strand:+ start:224924 stop:225637 length:714 start_codon:yes stop_codon:yes gene_type:complete
MKILLTNDDGIDAPGLEALWHAVGQYFSSHDHQIVVVAPDRGRSECGHSISGGDHLVVKEVKPNWFSVSGTPVECVRVAMCELAPETQCVFSGINAGANLGVDLLVSGTFAAAREAAIHNVDAMAISHYRRPDVPQTWDHAADWLSDVFDAFVEQQPASGVRSRCIWNVNLPAINPTGSHPPIEYCEVDRMPMHRVSIRDGEQLRFQSDFHGRPREPDSDVHHCFSGRLTISKVAPL